MKLTDILTINTFCLCDLSRCQGFEKGCWCVTCLQTNEQGRDKWMSKSLRSALMLHWIRKGHPGSPSRLHTTAGTTHSAINRTTLHLKCWTGGNNTTFFLQNEFEQTYFSTHWYWSCLDRIEKLSLTDIFLIVFPQHVFLEQSWRLLFSLK